MFFGSFMCSYKGRRYKIDCEPENFFRDGSFDAIVAQSFDLGRLWAADAKVCRRKKSAELLPNF